MVNLVLKMDECYYMKAHHHRIKFLHPLKKNYHYNLIFLLLLLFPLHLLLKNLFMIDLQVIKCFLNLKNHFFLNLFEKQFKVNRK